MPNLRSEGGVWWFVNEKGEKTIPYQAEDRQSLGFNPDAKVALEEYYAKNGIVPPAPLKADPLPPAVYKKKK